jgi:hypothetical protein
VRLLAGAGGDLISGDFLAIFDGLKQLVATLPEQFKVILTSRI